MNQWVCSFSVSETMLDGTKMTASLRSKFVIIDQLQLVITLHKLQTETDNNRKYHSSQACVIQKGRVRLNLKLLVDRVSPQKRKMHPSRQDQVLLREFFRVYVWKWSVNTVTPSFSQSDTLSTATETSINISNSLLPHTWSSSNRFWREYCSVDCDL